MTLKNLIQNNKCLLLKSGTKTEALMELTEASDIADKELLRKEIFYREQIMSTGLGQGIGIPHVRLQGVTQPEIIVGVVQQALVDYESLDSAPIHVIVMIIVGAEQHKEYLRILSLIMGRLKDKTVLKSLASADEAKKIAPAILGE